MAPHLVSTRRRFLQNSALFAFAPLILPSRVWAQETAPSKRLTFGCILLLWCGLAADALATRMMGARIETIRWDLHTISGYGALALMAVLTVFGTIALVRRRESILAGFQRLAIPVWTFWVLSYATGVVLGVQRVTTG